MFNPPPVVAEIDADDDDDIDLDEDEDDEGTGGGASKKRPPRQKRTDSQWKYMEAVQMRLRLETNTAGLCCHSNNPRASSN